MKLTCYYVVIVKMLRPKLLHVDVFLFRFSRELSNVMTVFICSHAYLMNDVSKLHQIIMHVVYGHASVLLLWRCDTLCSSGFVGDVK